MKRLFFFVSFLYIDVPERVLNPSITVLAILLDGPVKLYCGSGQVITCN
jgi:hypothetical protein